MTVNCPEFKMVVGICREDNPRDVDEAYGPGTYASLYPKCIGCFSVFVDEEETYCPECQAEIDLDAREKSATGTHGRPE
jgi:hypothetical protein